MRTIAILGAKGGSGKSTITVHLAVAAARAGARVTILDLDPQGSALAWSRRRRAAGAPPGAPPGAPGAPGQGREASMGSAGISSDPFPSIEVLAARVPELPGLLSSPSRSGSIVLADCAGRADTVALALLERADVCLVPIRPSILDLDATQRTIEQARTAKAKAVYAVMNAVPSFGTRHLEAQAAMRDLLPMCPVSLGQRVAYSDALNSGLSVEELDAGCAAAYEVRRLFRWIESLGVGTYTRRHSGTETPGHSDTPTRRHRTQPHAQARTDRPRSASVRRAG